MSWTPCERCGEPCREHGPLCDYCERDDRLAQDGPIEKRKQDDAEHEQRRLKQSAGHGSRRTGKARRKGTRGAFGGKRK